MALPTGPGSEILKSVGGSIANSASGTSVLTTPALSIITISGITITNTTGTQSRIKIAANNGSDRFPIHLTYIDPYETFAFNEKLVLEAGQILKIFEHSNQNVDYWVSYILQDWS